MREDFALHFMNMLGLLCSHQMVAMEPLLLRGDELNRLPIVALGRATCTRSNPLSMEGITVDLQHSKSNKLGDKVDQRIITFGCTLHKCPLTHLGLHFFRKLSVDHMGGPIRWEAIESGEWYVVPPHILSRASHAPLLSQLCSRCDPPCRRKFNVIDIVLPATHFQADTRDRNTSAGALTRRVTKSHVYLYGRDNICKVLHLNRVSKADGLNAQGCAPFLP